MITPGERWPSLAPAHCGRPPPLTASSASSCTRPPWVTTSPRPGGRSRR